MFLNLKVKLEISFTEGSVMENITRRRIRPSGLLRGEADYRMSMFMGGFVSDLKSHFIQVTLILPGRKNLHEECGMAELSLLTGNRTVKGLIGSEEAVGRSLGLPAPGQSP